MEKKKIKYQIETFNGYDLLIGPIEKVIKNLNDQKEKLESEGWENIEINEGYTFGSTEYIAYGIKLETDKDFEKRKKQTESIEKSKEKKEQREKEQYLRLKEKFEKQ